MPGAFGMGYETPSFHIAADGEIFRIRAQTGSTYYLGTGALKGPLRAYYLGTWGAKDTSLLFPEGRRAVGLR